MHHSEQAIFVSMPFASSRRPSLGLSLLKAKLQEAHISSFIYYPFLPFASQVGTSFYEDIADGNLTTDYLLGEWIFSPWLFSDPTGDVDVSEEDRTYLQYVQKGRSWLGVKYSKGISHEYIEAAIQVRQHIPAFFEEALNAIDWKEVRFVGFTSVFQQHVASLAFARMLKKRYPHLVIVFGGANVEGPMGRGLLRSFPWIDAIVSGEAENIITPLVSAVLAGEDYALVPGVWTRRSVSVVPAPHVQMDELPYPLFDDFFDQYSLSIPQGGENPLPSIMVETSRGCWWGEHSHCTFCGLNGLSMAYRSKSPQRAATEIIALWDGYGDRASNMLAVDNILDYRYINTVLPQLARHSTRISLFYETKANLKKTQLAAMVSANIRSIQPGIESLSTHVLKVMRKGISALHNVQLLKWCQEYNLFAFWNILWGFPEERPQDYVQANDWARRIFHLRPPVSVAPVRLDRFSPLFDDAEAFGIKDIKPVRAYDYIFAPLSAQERFELAYYFEYDYREKPGSGYATKLTQTVNQWCHAYQEAALFYFPAGAGSLLIDTRTEPQLWLLDEVYTALLDMLDAIAIENRLAEQLKIDSALLATMLETLDEHGWILQEENKVLGLPIRLGRYQPSGKAKHLLSTLFDTQTGQATLTGRITVPLVREDQAELEVVQATI